MKKVIIDSINEVLLSKGGAAADKIESQTDLRKDLGFDSFDLAELTVRLEDKTGVDIFRGGVISKIGEIEKLLSDVSHR
jgi:acyl carrier protein